MIKSEIVDWKYHPVTMEMFHLIKTRVEGLKDELVFNAKESDPRILAWKSGAIQAYLDILDLDFEEAHGN